MNKLFVAICFAIALISIGALAYLPPAMDQPVFAAGGRKMLFEGALPYRDIIDTKPPGLFFIYGVASVAFGPSVLDFRILDAFFHLIALALFYFYLKARFASVVHAAAAVALYAVMIVSLGADNTTQAETFALLPALLTFVIGDAVARHKPTERKLILYGIATGCLFIVSIALKYTFAAPTFAALLFVASQRDAPGRKRFLYIASSIVSIAAFIGLSLFILESARLLDDMLTTFRYLQGYASLDRPLTFESLHNLTYIGFSTTFIVTITPAIFLFAVIGMYRASRRRSIFYLHLFVQLVAGVATILLEQKNFTYHFARVFWIIAPFAVAGITASLELTARLWKQAGAFRLVRQFGIVAASLLLLFFSPITTSILNGYRMSYLTLRSGVRSPEVQELVGNIYYNRGAAELADSLAAKLQPNDEVYIFGSNLMPYLFLNKLPPTPQLSSYQFQGPFVQPEWKRAVMDDLRRKPPKFVVIESGDFIDFITKSGVDSYAAFVAWDELFNFVLDRYNDIGIIGNYEIYERSGEAL